MGPPEKYVVFVPQNFRGEKLNSRREKINSRREKNNSLCENFGSRRDHGNIVCFGCSFFTTKTMKILLLGDYSNVHATLAEGLRALGHKVVVASDGDGWKNYPRDIDLKRPGHIGSGTLRQRVLDALYVLRLRWLFMTKFRSFDVVQIVNPVFVPLRAERITPFYRKLRRHNCKVFLAAYGMDHYWVKAGLDCKTFRYSDFNIGEDVRHDLPENEIFINEWLRGPKGDLNKSIAEDCNGIPAGLYEYWASYSAYLEEDQKAKLQYIPFPIQVKDEALACGDSTDGAKNSQRRVRFFIGIQRSRSSYKGTDIMLRALEHVKERYPRLVEIHKVESVPFDEYRRLMQSSDVILDQLYSYTPAMNALEAMSQGLVVVGGAEPEYYALQEEAYAESSRHSAKAIHLRPIINVAPTEESVYEALCNIVEHREDLPHLKKDSQDFVRRYHDYKVVAQQYLDFWNEH